jgi:preprotein translocase subunit SecA
MANFWSKLFGDANEREIKKLSRTIEAIESLENDMKGLTDSQLQQKTNEFKERLGQGETPDGLLAEAFAVVREASARVLKMRHFPVQLMGGIVLHQGRISEMKTGEGKTLVATMPAYLNALTGKGVHIVTVNDYLATRDSQWMGEVYKFLGLEVGLIVHGLDFEQRKKAYNADITYGTNNEFGFDYLRDNMVIYKDQMVQRELNYAIIDEVDSILIDEARTPLIISGAGEKSTKLYSVVDGFVRGLRTEEHFTVDEKASTVTLTEDGVRKAEQYFNLENLADPENMEISHHINQALKAHRLMNRDIDYVVKDNQVIIVDEFTGRLMLGRRYSDGLHQAIEAKERVKVERESKTLATITFQNYFRMYNKLAGMTGTAATEEEEFRAIYGMDVVEIPTNMPMVRDDMPDVVYRSTEGKFRAVVEDIIQRHSMGQPILVGTISIENSELLSKMLERRGITHQVLNAKYHEKEAQVIAQAGQRGTVTISTNMAGRGTDIVLGEGVKKFGGLHVIGTERHESRRIDNQLRGRSGRQGDQGSSQFYISMEDELMRLFGSEKIMGMIDRLGFDDSQPIEHSILSKSIENAQKKVEARNFDIRKHVLQYDDVMNKQREVIYAQRRQVLEGESLRGQILEMIENTIDTMLDIYTSNSQYPEEWDLKGLQDNARKLFLTAGGLKTDNPEDLTRDGLKGMLMEIALRVYNDKEEKIGSEQMRELERVILLRVVDMKWMENIDNMDQLRQGIGLRAYGQEDPVRAYQKEGYDMFREMIDSIKEDTVKYLYRVQVEQAPVRERVARPMEASHGEKENKPIKKEGKKVGRNDPCPCGSGKKYKKCCGR